jgi:riboflavin synthase
MFTGLIEALGRVKQVERTADGMQVTVAADFESPLAPGESLAVNGVCLTVIESSTPGIRADVSPETERVTTLGSLAAGSMVNLERAMRADARFGGHFVQGHVDATGRIDAIEREGDAYRVTVGFPPQLERFLVHKGSIAVDGISLTIASLDGSRFEVQIIPHTWERTNLHAAAPGQAVNLECDILGKYVARALALGMPPR